MDEENEDSEDLRKLSIKKNTTVSGISLLTHCCDVYVLFEPEIQKSFRMCIAK